MDSWRRVSIGITPIDKVGVKIARLGREQRIGSSGPSEVTWDGILDLLSPVPYHACDIFSTGDPTNYRTAVVPRCADQQVIEIAYASSAYTTERPECVWASRQDYAVGLGQRGIS